jgi:hypothetical protein
MSIKEWLEETNKIANRALGLRHATTLASFGEKPSIDHVDREASKTSITSVRSLRHLPFEQETFESICDKFQVHKSIVRTLARSDLPMFSCDNVVMKGQAAKGNKPLP